MKLLNFESVETPWRKGMTCFVRFRISGVNSVLWFIICFKWFVNARDSNIVFDSFGNFQKLTKMEPWNSYLLQKYFNKYKNQLIL